MRCADRPHSRVPGADHASGNDHHREGDPVDRGAHDRSAAGRTWGAIKVAVFAAEQLYGSGTGQAKLT